jgi:glucose/arabinose dehydrogenase
VSTSASGGSGILKTRTTNRDRVQKRADVADALSMRHRTLGPIARIAVLVALAPAIVALQAPPAHASTTYKLLLKISGLDAPVYMEAMPGDNNRYFIVEKGGTIQIVDFWVLQSTPFLDITSIVSSDDERGLLSMAFDPDYLTNRRFYVYYTDLSGNIVIARYLRKADDANHADPNSEVILTTIAHPNHSNHNGGQLQFDPIAAENGSSMLYFATGDGGGAGDPDDNAQNLSVPLGKLFRIDVNDPNFTREMYAYGLRNPWRFSFDMLNGDIRIGDVGQGSWEELDYIKNADATVYNFGWRKYEGKHLYHDEVIDETHLKYPFQEYAHTDGNCAVIGGYMFRGAISALYGYYLYADLCTGNIWRRKPGHNPVLMNVSGDVSDIVSFAEGNPGSIFVISIDGSIYRLTTA